LEQKPSGVADPVITKDGRLLKRALGEVEEAQAAVDAIYARRAKLERKMTR
jgi:hypothetical protein